ncbi:MAG: hypothetical protein B7733_25165 [Myxococcales bacterium FL481]|nr:MAG: hypothetical protein B7733_25165 [Myxococcales bacterium FL481]
MPTPLGAALAAMHAWLGSVALTQLVTGQTLTEPSSCSHPVGSWAAVPLVVDTCVDDQRIRDHVDVLLASHEIAAPPGWEFRVTADATGTQWQLVVLHGGQATSESAPLAGRCEDIEEAIALKIVARLREWRCIPAQPNADRQDDPSPVDEPTEMAAPPPMPRKGPRETTDEPSTPTVELAPTPRPASADLAVSSSVRISFLGAVRDAAEIRIDAGWSTLPGYAHGAYGRAIEVQPGVDLRLKYDSVVGASVHLLGWPQPGQAPTDNNSVLGTVRLCQRKDLRRVDWALCAYGGVGRTELSATFSQFLGVLGVNAQFGVKLDPKTLLRLSAGAMFTISPQIAHDASVVGEQLLAGVARRF